MNANQNPPPATNRGVEKKIVSLRIHWIEGTFKKNVEVRYDTRLSSTKTEAKPFNVYNVGVRYPDGRVELSHTVRKEMGVHVVTSGATLDTFPIEPIEYLKSLVEAGCTITRIDLAADAYNCKLKPQRATYLLKKGKCKTRARKTPRWDDPSDIGYTQYIGKKGSQIFVRIYDKAAEMGLSGDWTRVEISYRQERAHAAALRVLAGTDYRAMIRSFCDFEDWKEWNELFNLTPVSVAAEQKDTNTQAWLLKTCAPALAREIHLSGDDDFYFRFIDSVKAKLEELREVFDGS